MPHVYILRCGDGSYYVGSTRTLETRLEQHSIGAGGEYTRKRQPVILVFAEEYDRVDEAWEREKQRELPNPQKQSCASYSTRRVRGQPVTSR